MLLCRVALFLFIAIQIVVAVGWFRRVRKRLPRECRGKGDVVEVGGGSSFTLSSPHYPAAYDYHTSCRWDFSVSSREVVLTLVCDRFDLQPPRPDGTCPDYLAVQKHRFCGHSIPSAITVSNISWFHVAFHSNGKDNYFGFHCTLTATNANTQNCACGKGGGGREGPPAWLAALVPTNKTATSAFCSASVVSERFLLTSASCASRIKYNKYNYEVLVRRRGVANEKSLSTRLAIRKVFIHPAYVSDISHSEANLALVHLKDAIIFRRKRSAGGGDDDDDVLPACLPHTQDSFLSPDLQTSFSGVGRTDKVELQTVSQTACAGEYTGRGVHISGAWLCARPKPSPSHPSPALPHPAQPRTSSFCVGELGGPLVVREGGRWVLVGVAAFSDGHCARETQDGTTLPLVFTRITRYLGWVRRTIGQDNTCSL